MYRMFQFRYSTATNMFEPSTIKRRLEDLQSHDKTIFQYDKIRPHVTTPAKKHLETLKWDILPYPPYGPDTAPFDCHLFQSMKNSLDGRRFRSFEVVKRQSNHRSQIKKTFFVPESICYHKISTRIEQYYILNKIQGTVSSQPNFEIRRKSVTKLYTRQLVPKFILNKPFFLWVQDVSPPPFRHRCLAAAVSLLGRFTAGTFCHRGFAPAFNVK